MKIKYDFITNSSSCNYVIMTKVDFKLNGEDHIIYKYGTNVTTLDMIKMIEGELQYIDIFESIQYKRILINYIQTVIDIYGDGWGSDTEEPGDYYFSGSGWRFEGNGDELKRVMSKNDIITWDNGKIIFPHEWILECEPEMRNKKENNDNKKL